MARSSRVGSAPTTDQAADPAIVTSRRTSLVLAVIAAVIFAVIGLFGQALLSNRSSERDAARARFNDEAKISSALISSSFDGAVPSVAENAGKTLGAAKVDRKALEDFVAKGKLSYAVVLDAQGNIIARTGSADASVVKTLDEGPKHVKAVLAGAPWQMSGLTKGNVAEFVSQYPAKDGSTRTLVQGFPVQLISGLVAGTLAKLPNAAKERALVSDDNGRVIASADPEIKIGSPAPKAGKDREETRSTIPNAALTTVLSQKDTDLYDNVHSSVQWLILIALTLAGIAAVLLLRRAAGQAVELQRAYGDLEQANRDLERTNVELSRSNGELEQFASVASHDLQEPLRKVQTFGDQLERRFAEDLNDEARDYLRRMRNASSRMSVLIDDLLRFSRVTTHARPHVTVDLDRVARDVLQDLETRIDETKATVEIEALPTVEGDATQMRQLLQNLIANALKFHREAVPPVVRVRRVDADEAGKVAISVEDNGIGFESNYEERIFRVFERLHPRDVYAGTGIGLALCRKIAERHGGSIRGEGRPGQGATFTVTLPAARSATAVEPPVPAAKPPIVHA